MAHYQPASPLPSKFPELEVVVIARRCARYATTNSPAGGQRSRSGRSTLQSAFLQFFSKMVLRLKSPVCLATDAHTHYRLPPPPPAHCLLHSASSAQKKFSTLKRPLTDTSQFYNFYIFGLPSNPFFKCPEFLF